jgi:hypothetical protein
MGEFDIASLSKDLGCEPTYSHKKGEIGQIRTVFESDMWSLTAPVDDSAPLEEHMMWLVEQLEDRYEALAKIKAYAKMDVFCSFTSGEQSFPPAALCHDLQINMEFSLILLDEPSTIQLTI